MNRLLEDEKGITVENMLAEMRTISKISLLKEEDNVIRSIIRGQAQSKILKDLQKKHPEEQIIKKDLDNFLVLYKDVFMDEAKKLKSSYGRRIMKQQDGLTNELIDLASMTKQLIVKFQKDNDNTNTVGAIRVAADIFMKVGKVEGLLQDKPEINVNIQMDKVVNQVTSEDSDLKRKLNRLMAKETIVDAEINDG